MFCKHSRIKEYLKDGRAVRIETVINADILGSGDPALLGHDYYPWWLDRLADDVTRTVPGSRPCHRGSGYKANATGRRYQAQRSPQGAVTPMAEVTLNTADVAQLAEMLQFLSQWLARDPARLATSLEQFTGHPAYGITQLRGDLERFAFLLGRQPRRTDLRPMTRLPVKETV